MNQSSQSPSTLREILSEAATFAEAVRDQDDARLAGRLEILREALEASPVVSADIEHEIVSLRELALRLSRSRVC